MLRLIEWLRNLEKYAGDLYHDSAKKFIHHQTLYELLQKSARDEAFHYHLMGSAAEYVRTNEIQNSSIFLDEETKAKIIEPLKNARDKLNEDNLTEHDVLKSIVETEFSEWNDIFLYVLHSLMEESREFIYAAAAIQNHKDMIQHHLEEFPDSKELITSLEILPKVWEEKILIVDDEKALLSLYASLFSDDAEVHTAGDGLEALALVEENFYKVILCDIAMPGMSGIELYEEVVSRFPNQKERFIFQSGYISPDRQEYFKERKLAFFHKPTPITELRSKVISYLDKHDAETLK